MWITLSPFFSSFFHIEKAFLIQHNWATNKEKTMVILSENDYLDVKLNSLIAD